MRMYQQAWNRLKYNPTEPLVISAHRDLHARIYKAIGKEKNMDSVYHLTLAMDGKRSRLSFISDGNKLEIRLSVTYTIEGVI